MSLLQDANQRAAADPGLNAFVTANAGSGKTKTLIDRVARLLLAGAPPAAILCVTYTKAAAAEMQRRLFDLLGGWSVMENAELARRLADLEGGAPERFDARDLSRARTLFAQALETPGGLKIQTIHAFCEKLLRRFPIEARVSPGFTVMDDAAVALIAHEARAAVAGHALDVEGPIAEAYSRLAVALDHESFQQMFATFETRREAIAGYVEACGGYEGMQADVWKACGFETPIIDPDAILREALSPPAIDAAAWKHAALACLASKNVNDNAKGLKFAEVAEAASTGEARPELVRDLLFTKEGGPRKIVATKAVGEGLLDWFAREQGRIGEALDLARAAGTAEMTVRVLALASAYAAAYRQARQERGALDFTDLVARVRDLVASRPDAAWVLYKLDGGVDHILVDEAQDTAPDQWRIVSALVGEFWSGEGLPRDQRSGERTLFVVGDEKQSIYSFQGADPDRLRQETEGYITRIEAAGRVAAGVPLTLSYRSTPQVLAFVDALFAAPETRQGVPPPRGEDVVAHKAFRDDHPGCVDLWPLEREEKAAEREAWDAPLDEEAETSANRRLARRIAGEIRALVERRDRVFDKEARSWRPASFGDVLILVRRRGVLFEEIIRELKRAGVPVAGADRLSLSAHIAFDDLIAAARFALFPDDDLTLAALLKAPLCGLDDDDVYALARDRKPRTLWAALQARAGEHPRWSGALEQLTALRRLAANRTPFDFYARLVGLVDADGRSLRARMLTRLGSEAGDVLDEFLARVLAAETRGLRDLESLAAAFVDLDIAVKREMESGSGEVRVMTTHGAKGLEAPIVFLPETTLTRSARGSPLLDTEAGGFLWSARAADDCAASETAREWRKRKEEDEAWRLLYVALTRARDRLVLCGRIDARTKDETVGGWYAAMRAAFAHPAIAGQVRELEAGDRTILRFGPDPAPAEAGVQVADRAPAPPPVWLDRPAPAEPVAGRYASPSRLAEQERGPAPSPLAQVEGLGRFRRGELIHRLLQLLPDVAPAERQVAAAALLGREPGLTDAQRREMITAAFAVLDDPVFAEVFGPGSRAEAAVAGSSPRLPDGLAISGRVDRLLVAPDRVLVVDFKTNRPAPARIEDADPAYRVQMAVYVAVLEAIFPGRRIEAALVWTDGPRLMPVPENMIAETLAGLARDH